MTENGLADSKRFDNANQFSYNREGVGGLSLEKQVGRLTYAPLWMALEERKMKRSQMAKGIGISKSTLAKLGHNEYVSLEVIFRICSFLQCKIEDVVEIEYVR